MRPMMTTVEQLLGQLGWGIESTPGVCGGNPRIAGTRIPVWTLENYRRLGLIEAQILGAFPTLHPTGPGQCLVLCGRSPRRDQAPDP